MKLEIKNCWQNMSEDEWRCSVHENGLRILVVSGRSESECLARAAEIVRAVNCHEALMDAAQEALLYINAKGDCGSPQWFRKLEKQLSDVIYVLSAAAPEKEGEQ